MRSRQFIKVIALTHLLLLGLSTLAYCDEDEPTEKAYSRRSLGGDHPNDIGNLTDDILQLVIHQSDLQSTLSMHETCQYMMKLSAQQLAQKQVKELTIRVAVEEIKQWGMINEDGKLVRGTFDENSHLLHNEVYQEAFMRVFPPEVLAKMTTVGSETTADGDPALFLFMMKPNDAIVLKMIGERAPKLFAQRNDDGATIAHYVSTYARNLPFLEVVAKYAPETLEMNDVVGEIPAHHARNKLFDSLPNLKFLAQKFPKTLKTPDDYGFSALDTMEANKKYATFSELETILEIEELVDRATRVEQN